MGKREIGESDKLRRGEDKGERENGDKAMERSGVLGRNREWCSRFGW